MDGCDRFILPCAARVHRAWDEHPLRAPGGARDLYAVRQKAGLFVERAREDDLLGREDIGERAARLSAHRHSDGILACVRHAAVHHLLCRRPHPAGDPAADDVFAELRRLDADRHGVRHGGDDGHHLRERRHFDGHGPRAARRRDAFGRILRRPLLAGLDERAARERADGDEHLRQHQAHAQDGARAVSSELRRLCGARHGEKRQRRGGRAVVALRARDDASLGHVPAGGAHFDPVGPTREREKGDVGQHFSGGRAVHFPAASGRGDDPQDRNLRLHGVGRRGRRDAQRRRHHFNGARGADRDDLVGVFRHFSQDGAARRAVRACDGAARQNVALCLDAADGGFGEPSRLQPDVDDHPDTPALRAVAEG